MMHTFQATRLWWFGLRGQLGFLVDILVDKFVADIFVVFFLGG